MAPPSPTNDPASTESPTVEPLPIEPLRAPADAVVTMPGSKSEANRALAAAALSGREVLIEGATPCDDVRHMVAGLATLGFAVRFVDEAAGQVLVGPRGADAPTAGELFCGNAGTALRFLVSIAALTPGEWTVTGDAHMRTRPIGPLVDAWRRAGVAITAEGGCPPVRVTGASVDDRALALELDPSVSSQFVSSLLLAGSGLAQPLEVAFTAPPASLEYAELTCRVLVAFGCRATVDAQGARVEPRSGAVPERYAVAGDWSAVGFLACLQMLTGSRLCATNLRTGTNHPDEALIEHLAAFAEPGPRTLDVSAVPDQFMNLAVVAAAREGTTRFVGAANLRAKECDRLAVTARELARIGVPAREHDDGLEVDGVAELEPATIDPEGDHRVAIAFTLAGLLSPGIAVADPTCVSKSDPAFFQRVDALRERPANVIVVGMRCSGKSTFARLLGVELDRVAHDTDSWFTSEHDSIASYVAEHGWTAFREREASVLEHLLRTPGQVIALGGGAVETDAVRALLRDQPLVVHVHAPLATLRERLAANDPSRPSVTGADPHDELGTLLARRTPLYDEMAKLWVDGTADPGVEARRIARAIAARCAWPGVRP